MGEGDGDIAKRLDRTVIYESPWVNLYRDRIELPTGRVVEQYHVLEFGRGSISVLVWNRERQVLLERVPRYPAGVVTWELPAGRVEQGETVLEAARREVLEETGYDTVGHELVHVYHPLNALSAATVSLVSCRAGEKVGDIDPDEIREARWFEWDEIARMLRRRDITDALTLVGLMAHALGLGAEGARGL